MRIKSLFTLFVLVMLLPGAVLSLSGCGGAPTQSSTSQDSDTAQPSEPIVAVPDAVEESSDDSSVPPTPEENTPEIEPVVAEPSDDVSFPPVPEESAPEIEPIVETPVAQPILTWARNAGGLGHCDRLLIYEDGRAEAIVCRGNASEPMVNSTLSEEDLAQVLAWAATYTLFTRTESEMSSAVRATTLYGKGDVTPETANKVEVASFAANLFFVLTGTN